MKILLLVLQLCLTMSVTVQISDKCTCAQIFSQADCQKALCSWSNSQCVPRIYEQYCALQSPCTQTCANVGGVCQLFAGCSAYVATTALACSTINKQCTSDGTTCINLNVCSGYKTAIACVQDNAGNYCYWNSSVCASVQTCSQLPITFTTDASCRAAINTCTVAQNGQGCVQSGNTCSDQKTLAQCVTNLTQIQKCYWNSSTSSCVDLTCANAPTSMNTAILCQKYLNTCTITDTESGCQVFKSQCSEYTKVSCSQITANACIWSQLTNACVDYSCANAGIIYTNDTDCKTYLSTCTVSTSGSGCVTRPKDCEGMSKGQCITNSTGGACYWYAPSSSCITYTCVKAPVATFSSYNCNSYSNICTVNSTSTGCIQKTCAQAESQSICILLNCLWLSGACVTNTCASAPTTLTTNTQCQAFQTGCVTTGSGCMTLDICIRMTSQTACVVDIKGNKCTWSAGACKQISCSDVSYPTYASCNDYLSTCTTNGTSCISLDVCANMNRYGCVYGTDGPCQWVSGKCQLFKSCSSIVSASPALCQSISTLCTSDGINCTAVQYCSATPAVSCYYGIDGQCVVNNSNANVPFCQKFTSCSQLNYQTYKACIAAMPTCTTNGLTCIDLGACSTYTSVKSCISNISGGVCVWDTTKSACRDQVCTDVTSTTHDLCQTVGSTCTTNGIACVTKALCSSYTTSNACTYGTDGQCIYQGNKCRAQLCSDISLVLGCPSTCVSNGTTCVLKAKCATYLTNIACQAGGTDGYCVWNGSSCDLMSQCSDANQSQSACVLYNKMCQWSASTSQVTTCSPYQCNAWYTLSQSCQPIPTYNASSYLVCAVVNSNCQSAALTDLTQTNCYTNSANTAYWNTTTNTCTACKVAIVTNNTNQSTWSYQIIAISIIYLII